MKELLVIAISSAFVSNVVLSQFLGICSFVGVSKKVETAAGMGGAVIFVITIASVVASLIYQSLAAAFFTSFISPPITGSSGANLVAIKPQYRTQIINMGRRAFIGSRSPTV